MMSATLRNHLRRYLLAKSGWFTKEPGMLTRITGATSEHYPKGVKDASDEDKAAFAVGGDGIQHHVLVVSDTEEFDNIEEAVDAPEPLHTEQAEKGAVGQDKEAAIPSPDFDSLVEEFGLTQEDLGAWQNHPETIFHDNSN